jgi:hypothetical protein
MFSIALLQVESKIGTLIEDTEFGPHGITKIVACLTLALVQSGPVVLFRTLSHGPECVKLCVVMIREFSNPGAAGDSKVNVRVLHHSICRPQVLKRVNLINLFTAAGPLIQLVKRIPERVRGNKKIMTDLAALISHDAHQFLAIRLGTCLFTPPVSEHSSHETYNSGERDTAERPSQSEPSTPVCHAHLTNIELIANTRATRLTPLDLSG